MTTRNRKFLRPVLSILAAMLAPATAIFLFVISLGLRSAHGLDTDDVLQAAGIGVIVLSVASMHVLLIGIPAIGVLQRFGILRWWSCCLAGFFAGALPIPLMFANPFRFGGDEVTANMLINFGQAMLFYGAFGFLGSLAFWLVWNRLRSTVPTAPATPPDVSRPV